MTFGGKIQKLGAMFPSKGLIFSETQQLQPCCVSILLNYMVYLKVGPADFFKHILNFFFSTNAFIALQVAVSDRSIGSFPVAMRKPHQLGHVKKLENMHRSPVLTHWEWVNYYVLVISDLSKGTHMCRQS